MRKPVYQIDMGGKDVSSLITPILISIRVIIQDDGPANLELQLDDKEGQVELPPIGTSITAALGYEDSGLVEVFGGKVNDVTSAGSRGQGRVLVITADGADLGSSSNAKQTEEKHHDDGTLSDVVQKFAPAGISVAVSEALGKIHRPYWFMGNESFFEWMTRTAKEVGATFTMENGKASLTPRLGSSSASGAALSGIHATWGDNLIAWSIAPVISRPNFGSFATRWYDMLAAKWNVEKSVGGAAGAALINRFKAATSQNAQDGSAAISAEGQREKGKSDTVTIDGEPLAQRQATCSVSGVRPGVDGSYTVSGVAHELSRQSGFITELTLVLPSGGAGVDSRGSSGG